MTAVSTVQDAAIKTRFGIDSELEERVKAQARTFQTAYRRTVEEAWKLGWELRQAKSQVRHGQWIPWVEERIGLTPRSAQRLMALHEAYPEMRQVSHLRSVSSAMRALPSGRESQRGDEAESGAASGAGASLPGDNPEQPPAGGEGGPADGRVAAAARELSRVVERLEPILHARPTGSAIDQEFPALCEALQTIVSALIGYADSAVGGEGRSAREFVSALEAAVAKARQVRDSMLAQDTRLRASK